MHSPSSFVLHVLLAVSLGFASDSVHDPCTVRAWVRADDLAPTNDVSHGELKVKLGPHCQSTITSVTLRLRLDEYAEVSTVSDKTTPGEPELWDWHEADWSSTKHKRTAWKIEKTQFQTADGARTLHGQDWKSGVVFPFSVVSPNVNYPAAIHPLIFRGKTRRLDTRRSVFGLGYRYTALITLTAPDGDGTLAKTVEVPAGFTAFRPTSTLGSEGEAEPRDVAVDAVGLGDYSRTTCYQREAGDPEVDTETWRTQNRLKLRLRVTLPPGGRFVQGGQSNVTITVEDTISGSRTQGTTNWLVSSALELGMSTAEDSSGTADYDDPTNPWTRHRYKFNEIHALMWKTTATDSDTDTDKCGSQLTPMARQPLRIRVPERFPRTADDTASLHDAPFRIKAFLGIIIREYHDAPHMDPLPDQYSRKLAGERREETEHGWEYGPCDRAQFNKRGYFARVPVRLVGLVSLIQPRDELAIHYLENGGRVPAPRIEAGHLDTPLGDVEFEMAEPVSVRYVDCPFLHSGQGHLSVV